MQTKVLKWF